MKKRNRRHSLKKRFPRAPRGFALSLLALILQLLLSVPAFADEIYEPMPGDYQNVMPWVILIGAAVIGIQLIAGIVLIIIFAVRRKNRRRRENNL